jgi:hypothetical protein
VLTFDSHVVLADMLFGSGFLLDVYFDSHVGDSNIMLARKDEVRAFLIETMTSISKDIASQAGNGIDGNVILAMGGTLTELGENMNALDNLSTTHPGADWILFTDSRGRVRREL